ncbi:MAG: response regulator [Candidatus Woesearchaeota archaeon]
MPKPTVLVADDEAAVRKTLSEILEVDGYKVRSVADGEEAMSMLGEEDFDVVLSDIKMPRCDGRGLLEGMKEKFPDTPLMLITGESDYPDEAVDLIRGGAYCYLTKSAGPETKTSGIENLASMVDRVREASRTARLMKRLDQGGADDELLNQIAASIPRRALYISGADVGEKDYFYDLFADFGFEVKIEKEPKLIFDELRHTKMSMVIFEQGMEGPEKDAVEQRIMRSYPFMPVISALDDAFIHDVPKIFDVFSRRMLEYHDSNKSDLFCICGPSAVGKTSTADMLTRMLPYTFKIPRDTSRRPRPNEIAYEDHIFRTPEYFEDEDKFEMKVEHNNNDYGIQKGFIDFILGSGKDAIFTQLNLGAVTTMHEKYPSMNIIVMNNENVDELMERISERGHDVSVSPEKLERQVSSFRNYWREISGYSSSERFLSVESVRTSDDTTESLENTAAKVRNFMLSRRGIVYGG